MSKKFLGKVVAGAALGGASLLVGMPGVAMADGHDTGPEAGQVSTKPHWAKPGHKVTLTEVCKEPQDSPWIWSKITGKVELTPKHEPKVGEHGKKDAEHGKKDAEHGKKDGEQETAPKHPDGKAKSEDYRLYQQSAMYQAYQTDEDYLLDKEYQEYKRYKEYKEYQEYKRQRTKEAEAAGATPGTAGATPDSTATGPEAGGPDAEAAPDDNFLTPNDLPGATAPAEPRQSAPPEQAAPPEQKPAAEPSATTAAPAPHGAPAAPEAPEEAEKPEKAAPGDAAPIAPKGDASAAPKAPESGRGPADEHGEAGKHAAEGDTGWGDKADGQPHAEKSGEPSSGRPEKTYAYWTTVDIPAGTEPGHYQLKSSCGHGTLVVVPSGWVEGGDGGTGGGDLATGGTAMLSAAALGGLVLFRRRRVDDTVA